MAGIGFFAPLPLAIMMPFMAGQSMVMGEAFGKSYQYGKRKISSMSNEEFNKLTTADLAKQLSTDYISIIPSLQKSMTASKEFQSFIIQELAAIIRELPKDIYTGLTQDEGNSQNLLPLANADTGSGSNISVSTGNFVDSLANFFNKLASKNTDIHGGDPLNRPDETNLNQDFFNQKTDTSSVDNTISMVKGWSRTQLITVYNQRNNDLSQYNSYGITNSKFRQILVTQFKSMTFSPSSPDAPVKDPTPQASLTYHSAKIKLLKTILEWKTSIAKHKSQKYPQGQPQHVRGYKTHQNKLRSLITHARNNPTTKSEANNDWNKRIWLK